MSGREEIPERLLAALEQLAGERAPDLIREAEAEARAEVKAILRERIARAMLAESERLLRPAEAERKRETPAPKREEPPAPARETGDGWWLYCVAGDDHPGLPEELDGVSAGRPPRIVRSEGLSAVASSVPLEEFGEGALKRNLNDLEWLEGMVRAHESVLDAALANGTIVPMRVCTIYRSEEHVRQALSQRRSLFEEALEWLDGRAEWGVKMLARRDRIDELARRRAGAVETGGRSEGGAYFARKQGDRAARDHAEQIVDEVVQESHARLEEWATASEVLPAQRREVSGHEGEMIFNGAYLVDDERIGTFEDVLRRLEEQYGEAGVTFQLTGPWPAYHFVGDLEQIA